MLHFVLGRAKSGKTSYITDLIKNNKAPGGIFIVPEQFSHKTERELCKKCKNSVSLYTEVTSFRRLAAKVKATVGGVAANIIDDGERIIHLHSAVCDVSAGLSVMGKGAPSPDRLTSILATIDEFKSYGVSPEQLAGIANDVNETLGKKISDLSMIYAAYENSLGSDSFDVYDELKFVAKAVLEHKFFQGKTVYLDSFTAFTSAQFDIIEATISRAKDVYIALELPENAEEGMENGIFDRMIATKARLISLAQNNGIEFEEIFTQYSPEGAVCHIDRALFSDDILVYEGDTPEITITSSDSIFEECELCAAHILDGVKGGARFRDFSVAVCSEEYLPVCKAVFERYAIPAYTSMAVPLVKKPVIALILSALECSFRGLRTELIMEYIKTGFCGVSSKSLDIFENYVYTWSPRSYEWEKEEDFRKNPLGISEEETDESRELLRIINSVRRKVCSPLRTLSSAIAKSKSGQEIAEALYNFINDINLPRRCSAYAYIRAQEGNLNEAQEYESILGILYQAIDSLAGIKADKLSAEEFYNLFRIVISQYELATIPPTVDCVTIVNAERADGEHCEWRIVLGANDGVFPKNADSTGILTENDRAELSDFGINLSPVLYERVFEGYRMVHSVLCSAARGIYISYRTISPTGEEMYEAQAVSRMREFFPSAAKGLSISEARRRAITPCFDESVAEGSAEKLWKEDIRFSERLDTIKRNSKSTRGPILSRENIEGIFGKKIRLSASKADLFSSCRYAYFLRYGLRAYPRARGEISPLEAGTLMHYVLERVICRLAEEKTYDENTAESWTREAVREYLKRELSGAGELSGRMSFIISSIEETVVFSVLDICRELKKGSFIPSEFELDFSYNGDLPPIELSGENTTVSFVGKVDRVDTYSAGDNLYFRVVDYKSGKKLFSLDETVNGIGMQLLLYMFALEEMGFSRYGKEPKAAGVMYVPLSRSISSIRGEKALPQQREGVVLRNPDIIEAMESGENKEYLPISVKADGSLSKSSSALTAGELERIKERIKGILISIGEELSNGEIEPNPYFNGDFNSCKWCEYKSVCAFDEKRGNDCMRELFAVRAKDIVGGEEI